jgi:hypothetical protein
VHPSPHELELELSGFLKRLLTLNFEPEKGFCGLCTLTICAIELARAVKLSACVCAKEEDTLIEPNARTTTTTTITPLRKNFREDFGVCADDSNSSDIFFIAFVFVLKDVLFIF